MSVSCPGCSKRVPNQLRQNSGWTENQLFYQWSPYNIDVILVPMEEGWLSVISEFVIEKQKWCVMRRQENWIQKGARLVARQNYEEQWGAKNGLEEGLGGMGGELNVEITEHREKKGKTKTKDLDGDMGK